DCPELTEREQDAPQVALITSVLTAVHGDFCARNSLAPNLVANTQDIRLLVRARLLGLELPDSSHLTHGWRSQHVLPQLIAVLDGKRSLRITDVGSETPFTIGDG